VLGRALGPLVCALGDLPAVPFTGVVLANELLDNVPFRLLERTAGGWSEVRVSAVDDRLVELTVPLDHPTAHRLDQLAPDAAPGARVAWQAGAGQWLRRALSLCVRGSVVVVDYTTSTPAMAERPLSQWLRTYRDHGRGGAPLEAPGAQDLTVEVAVDQLASVRAPDRRSSQADWLARHGIAELVEEGRRTWAEQAARPGLEAIRARSRIVEAEALCDPSGLGGFEVLEWDLA
jgi:SAM-dependent MidA family methyltransferase